MRFIFLSFNFVIDNRSTIRNLLKSIGLAKYCHRFEEADISYDDFLKIRDDQFEKLKIPVASKRKLKSEIKRINASWKSSKFEKRLTHIFL